MPFKSLSSLGQRFLLNRIARRTLFIHSEATPNPSSRKFIPEENDSIVPFFKNESSSSPAFEWGLKENKRELELLYNTSGRNPPKRLTTLANELLQLDGISRIFIGVRFLTATKGPETSSDWAHLSPRITSILDSYFTTTPTETALDEGNFIAPETLQRENGATVDSDHEEVTKMVIELLDTKVRPYVQSDGGDIAFIDYSDGIVRVKLHGACSSCASSSETLKRGVAAMMKYYIPEVFDVVDVNEEPGGLDSASLEAFEAFESELKNKNN
ncbi:hypothetical protein MDAP_002882 [Mitosporidium daphniae]|uniref:NifU-related protein n=1 Tax=Mitosporidium daphniae TaxID=1485682 RepID=A0A098VS05_9MICR|nr:NifU-related protein [Mitosporidium daphniae]KGG50506.1 NifU-related protein [Mitosporidium daphniae]|eukprot:XP_013236933.1 NifU-related protein [Mitosporidium daphniae]